MCPCWCPRHVLLLAHPPAHHLIHRGFRNGAPDRLAIAVLLTIVWDERCVIRDVGLELGHGLGEFRRARAACDGYFTYPFYK